MDEKRKKLSESKIQPTLEYDIEHKKYNHIVDIRAVFYLHVDNDDVALIFVL